MKKLLLLLFVTIPIVMTAQEKSYDSFLDNEKIWTIKNTLSSPEQTVSYTEYKLMDETSIEGISYKLLFSRYRWEYEDDWSDWESGEFGGSFGGTYIGEDNAGKVFFYKDNDNSIENLVTMDFSLQVGDVFQFGSDYDLLPYVVTAVSDTILENSFDRTPRKCIHLSHFFDGVVLFEEYHHDVWIEGIGSMKHGLVGMRGDLYGGAFRQLVKCTQQGNIIYQYDDATSVQSIKELPIDDTPIYDLQGRRVMGTPRKGLYIQNGKKVIVK